MEYTKEVVKDVIIEKSADNFFTVWGGGKEYNERKSSISVRMTNGIVYVSPFSGHVKISEIPELATIYKEMALGDKKVIYNHRLSEEIINKAKENGSYE